MQNPFISQFISDNKPNIRPALGQPLKGFEAMKARNTLRVLPAFNFWFWGFESFGHLSSFLSSHPNIDAAPLCAPLLRGSTAICFSSFVGGLLALHWFFIINQSTLDTTGSDFNIRLNASICPRIGFLRSPLDLQEAPRHKRTAFLFPMPRSGG